MPKQPPKNCPSDMVEAIRYFRLTPKYSPSGTAVIGMDVSNGTVNAPEWGVGAIVKIAFRIPKDTFTPMADLVIEFDQNTSGTPEVLIADLKELKESLEP